MKQLVALGEYDKAVAEIKNNKDHPLHPILNKAQELKLSLKPEWLALLHYNDQPLSRFRSRIDSPWFFMAENGKTDPQAELEATVVSFLAENAKAPMRLSSYCRFVARRHWLSGQLQGLTEVLPKQECREYQQYESFLQADHLTLVFPAAHPNSPASAFGHTLLRVDKNNQNPETRMLNMSINFAAEVPQQTNPLSYAALGLAGGFKGKYAVLPYHIKLREYGQIDNRDIWEFELSFNKEQMDFIIKHSYEMLIAHFDYYFFHENCAYQLLSLLDVATPEDRFTDHFTVRTIPLDTIKLLDRRGLIRSSRYIPSTVKSIEATVSALPGSEQQIIKSLQKADLASIKPGVAQLDPAHKTTSIEALANYYRYRRLNQDGSSTVMTAQERELLKLRSKLGKSDVGKEKVAPPMMPAKGHGTQKLSLGAEISDGTDNTVVIGYRPAYHGLNDPDSGYGSTTAIDFLSLRIAAEPDHHRVFLREFTILDIRSIEPRTNMFRPVSWRTKVGWEKFTNSDSAGFEFSGGAGVGFRHQNSGALGYLFSDLSYQYDKDLDENHAILGSVSLGGIVPISSTIKFLGEGGVGYDVVANAFATEISGAMNFAAAKNLAISLKHQFSDASHRLDGHQAGIYLNWYF